MRENHKNKVLISLIQNKPMPVLHTIREILQALLAFYWLFDVDSDNQLHDVIYKHLESIWR